jgi:hypothetical protein
VKLANVLFMFLILAPLLGCQGSVVSQMMASSYPVAPRNYKTAGFTNIEEVKDYERNSPYFAFKISADEWKSFYNRFPEYWYDIQTSKNIAFVSDFHPGYTAYAFKWNLDSKKKEWDESTTNRLASKNLSKGDDIYKIVFALGVPYRIMWDNDFDILMYENDTAVLLKNNLFDYSTTCKGCTSWSMNMFQSEHSLFKGSDKLLEVLHLTRPNYR